MTIKQLVDGHSRLGRIFDVTIQVLIVVSLVSFSLETLPGLTDSQRMALRVIETVTVLVFTAEYIARLLTSARPLKFMFSFLGLVDLLSILPFYISLGVDLRSLRSVRLLRLFRILKLARYNKAIRRFHRAFIIAREELVLYFFATLVMLYLAGVGIYYFENQAQPEVFPSVPHSLWWSVATLTTVGYGDAYPITPGGRFFTFLVLMLGLGVVAVPAGLVSAALSKARELED